ncbi:MAG: hypothetical protein LBP78_02065 [Acidaminococcales bacterium]|jgi:hypothetical protein|nr:hypothetical protein [Acidaminococcales bacterium]
MKKMLCALLPLLLAMTPIVAAADRWVWVDADDYVSYFFDGEAIKKVNSRDHPQSYSVWVKIQYTKAHAKELLGSLPPEIAKKYHRLSYRLELWQIDAEASEYRTVKLTLYRDGDEAIESLSDNNAKWKNIEPGSRAEATINAILEHIAKT